MAAKIRAVVPSATVDLIGGGKGDFIVIADGSALWNKKQEGRFPDEDAIARRVKQLAK